MSKPQIPTHKHPASSISSFIGASLSEPHTDVLAWDSVTRDIYRYRGTDRYLWAGAFSPALYFFLARPRRSQAPHRAAHSAHTNAGPLISGQQKVHDVRSDRVSFQSRTRSTSTSRKYSTCLNVNVVARSTSMRAHIAMHNAVARPGYLQQSTWHPVRSGFLTLSTCHGSDMTASGPVPVFKHAFVKDPCTCTCTWDTDRVPAGCVAPILKMRMRVSVTAAAAHWHWVQRSTSVK